MLGFAVFLLIMYVIVQVAWDLKLLQWLWKWLKI